MESDLTKSSLIYFMLMVVNCFLIYFLFPVTSSLFWLFLVLEIAAVALDLLAMAWALGMLPYYGIITPELIGGVWTIEQIIQTIILLAVTSTVIVPLLFALFVILLYFGKLRTKAMQQMLDGRPIEKERR